MKLKVCGLKHPENIREVAALAPDFIGLIFYEKSPRFMMDTLSPTEANQIPDSIKKVGVFVDHPADDIIKIGRRYKLAMIQLHGRETPDDCSRLRVAGFEVIKVFPVGDEIDWLSLEKYEAHIDYFLFDTQTTKHGGSGKRFNWKIMDSYPYETPYFLSGGIDTGCLADLNVMKIKPYALDVNSKFESSPGWKEADKLRELQNELHNVINF